MDETTRDVGEPDDAETWPEKRSSTDDVTLRFGPGVPPGVTRAWRSGGRRGRPLPWRIAGGLATLGLAVLTGLVVWWLLHGGPPVQVTGVTVTAPAGVQGCGATTTVVGVIHTNGGQGDVSYRWKRSDGQNSGVFTDSLSRGRRTIRVPLRWTVQGPGSLHAVATLEVVSPTGPDGTASASFDYTCR
ncbi:hypothetical protein [Actinoallomurus iriomotensis]|uniref:Uncharacterized protein n=1 Tax=Actinoallomurus iriomotensis TaxID=478107 RepID=A0A9W6RMU5_9ACTN|nr:hypothetical protein [Actinoallomurus iriomotensis]GLY78568.1 hypothetical protein Airi01_068350 [Actinoallomurus iriomotensis]